MSISDIRRRLLPWTRNANDDQNPPDLDELFNKLQQKLRSALKTSNKKTQNDEGNSVPSWFGFIGLFGLVVVLWILSGIFIVGAADQGVVLRFGKFTRQVGPGMHWYARFIERKFILNVQEIDQLPYNAQMLTKDENIVNVSIAVQYRIANPRDYLFNVTNPKLSLQEATASALRQVIGHSTLDDILTIGRAVVRQQVDELLKSILNTYRVGYEITDVTMQPATAPDEVKAAFDDAIKAQEDEQRFINQAKAYLEGVVPLAEGQAKRVIAEAQAYHQQQVLYAEGDTLHFLSLLNEYKVAPDIMRKRFYLDVMEEVFAKTSKILIDTDKSSNIMYLPLDRMLNAKAQPSDQQAALRMDNESVEKMIKQSQLNSQHKNTATTQRTGRNSYRGRGAY